MVLARTGSIPCGCSGGTAAYGADIALKGLICTWVGKIKTFTSYCGERFHLQSATLGGMQSALVLIMVCFSILVVVQMTMITTSSRRHAQLLLRVGRLESEVKTLRRRKPHTPTAPISGKLHLTMDGQTQTISARFEPTTLKLAKILPHTASRHRR
jgi:hypothetical protein